MTSAQPTAVEPVDRPACIAMAAQLAAEAALGAHGVALSALAAAALVAAAAVHVGSPAWVLGIGATVLLGVLERYLALRIALDARLFEALGDGRLADLVALDDALARAGLVAPAGAADAAHAAPTRPLDSRLAGAGRLCRLHRLAVLGQWATTLLAACSALSLR